MMFSGTARIGPSPERPGKVDSCSTEARRDAFVAFTHLPPELAITLRSRLPSGTALGCVLPAENFDPPGDHPDEPEFQYVDVLLNDFSNVNDDVGTLYGVRSGHFRQLLGWQPTVNPKVTRSLAIVAPGGWRRTDVLEEEAIRELSIALTKRGYDAIALRCKAGDDSEFGRCIDIATAMHQWTSLPIAHLAKEQRNMEGSPFCMTIRQPFG